MITSYSKETEKSIHALILFVTTYFGFVTLLQIKSKERSRLDLENDMCYAISKRSARVIYLVKNKHSHMLSHGNQNIFYNNNNILIIMIILYNLKLDNYKVFLYW